MKGSVIMEKYFSINQSGCSIRCKMYYNDLKSIKNAAISVHGFGSNKDTGSAERFAEYVLKKHKDVVIVTYDEPNHGEDAKRKLSLEDCFTYLSIVTEYVKSRFKTDDIYAYGTSFGGYQLLNYIDKFGSPFCKIALRCPAINLYDIVTGFITDPDDIKALSRNKPILVGFEKNVRIDNRFLDELKAIDLFEKDFGKFKNDIKIIQGTKDEYVPFDVVKSFAEKKSIPFVAVEGADHRFRDPKKMDTALKEIVELFGF